MKERGNMKTKFQRMNKMEKQHLIEEYKKERYLLIDKQISQADDNSQLELGDIDEYFYPLSR